MDALKVWLNFKYFGKKGYGEEIDQLVNLRESALKEIQSDKAFEVMHEPETLNLCFRLKDSSGNGTREKLNTFSNYGTNRQRRRGDANRDKR